MSESGKSIKAQMWALVVAFGPSLLPSGVGGTVIGYITNTIYNDLPIAIMFGLLGGLAIYAWILLIKARNVIPKLGQPAYVLGKQPISNADDLETTIQGWMISMGMTVKKEYDDKTYFKYVVTAPSGLPVVVGRSLGLDRYIQFQSLLGIQKDRKSILSLGKQMVGQLQREIAVELARARVIHRVDDELKDILIETREPIITITEASMVAHIDEVICAQNIIISIVANWKDKADAQKVRYLSH